MGASDFFTLEWVLGIEHLFWLGLLGAGAALVFAWLQYRRVIAFSDGGGRVAHIARAIRTGADAYLKRQYTAVVKFFAVVFVALCALAFLPPLFGWDIMLVNRFSPFAFLTGGFFTGLSGYIGMKVATAANSRTAIAAQGSLNSALRVSFSSGTVMGFVVAGLGLLDVTMWFLLLRFVFGADAHTIGESMVKFGLGVASMALFARVGGGIFTKAADVGADLVGKVEAGIPEDDPRNPAVIADNVGDNVGDVAGMGADLYEAYAHAVIATFALGVGVGYGYRSMLLPILIFAIGIIASIIGTFFVRTGEEATQKTLLHSLHLGTFVSAGIVAVVALPITMWVTRMNDPGAEYQQVYDGALTMVSMQGNAWGIYAAILLGIATGILLGYFTERYTSEMYSPTLNLAGAARTGSATVMIAGLSLGMRAVVGPIVSICAAALLSFFLSGGIHSFYAGLYGIGIASVGMLSTLGVQLATDAFGPVADNAGGLAQMAHLPAEVRRRTDALDSLGNTTAATGKGFAIGATSFSALALLVSYKILAEQNLGYALDLDITNPSVLIGLLLGAATAFYFGALTISAVHRAAQSVVIEVRRQFREIKGLMQGTAEPDYAACVDICTQSALKNMLAPALLAFIVPIGTGLVLGASGVMGLLAGIIVTGFALALFMMCSGGAWDNAKKLIESDQLLGPDGEVLGKGTEAHKAAVIGDTVGDPFKDTAGPSYNILITLSASVALVFVGLATAFSIL
ncbi:MAG: sodium-translocating pyrophosphatase [Promicromonosporaceae bacterium]|nr:sodium-translocating pyrophosphatase [Promicromonosporaceae bacterium]